MNLLGADLSHQFHVVGEETENHVSLATNICFFLLQKSQRAQEQEFRLFSTWVVLFVPVCLGLLFLIFMDFTPKSLLHVLCSPSY